MDDFMKEKASTEKVDGRKNNGGQRAGAGSPAKLKTKTSGTTQLDLSPEERRIAAALGGGRIVAGVRKALYIAAEHEGIAAKPDKE
ncbi:hypothetical protein [Uliginosibacterium sediminicola]|uniref:Uncharacterized protein n=1 Tax=Uliginosibacterium sediminicola TaxID=2024550 RepID=A0ABU9YWC0_9RHOO